jgi:hypothetical protein
MRWWLLPLLLIAPALALAQNFGNIKPNTILGNPDPTATKPAVPMDRSTFDVRQWGANDDNGATDSSAAINNAIAYVAGVGGTVDLGGGTYGVCANPVRFIGSGPPIHLQNGVIQLQTGCATPPQSILLNTVAPTAGFGVNNGLRDITLDGKCATKYVYEVNGGNQSTHFNVVVQNPAPNVTIANSTGLLINGGFEFKFGASNWVTATGTCYNTGNLPKTGIDHRPGSGNADFTGVLVVNFITGINSGGDDYFGPGTHIWGGCKLTGGGCTFDPALRGSTGLVLNGSGTAIGLELDDPAVNGIVLTHVDAGDRMLVMGNTCFYGQTPTNTQSCVYVSAGTVGSQVTGTIAPAIAAAGFPHHIVTDGGGIGPSTTITNNPRASVFNGEAPTIAMFGALPVSPAGCVGQTGYLAGATACTGRGWITSPSGGCQAKSLVVSLGAAPGAGATTAFTVQDNGVDTALTATLTGTGGFSFTKNDIVVDIGANHSITLRVNTTAGAPAIAEMRAILYGCG